MLNKYPFGVKRDNDFDNKLDEESKAKSGFSDLEPCISRKTMLLEVVPAVHRCYYAFNQRW